MADLIDTQRNLKLGHTSTLEYGPERFNNVNKAKIPVIISAASSKATCYSPIGKLNIIIFLLDGIHSVNKLFQF